MDGFSYVNIFATKGVEYLLVLGYLALFVFFFRALFKDTDKKQRDPGEE